MTDKPFKARLKTYFENKIGAFDYRNGWLKSDCPICGAEFKFGIHLRDNRTNCFVCEYKAQPINLVMHLEDVSYMSAKSIVAGQKEARYYEPPVEVFERKAVILPSGFKLINKEDDTILGKRAYKYATKTRGLTYSIIRKLKLGYSRDLNSTYYNHLIIPFYQGRKLMYFQARNLSTGPKFNNPPILDFGIGQNVLMYNVDALYRYREVHIVESSLNAITIAPNATAILTKSTSAYKLDLFQKAPVDIYNIILDPDAYSKAIELGLELVQKHQVRIVKLPIGLDVNDIGYKQTMKILKRTPLATWKDLLAMKFAMQGRRYKYEQG